MRENLPLVLKVEKHDEVLPHGIGSIYKYWIILNGELKYIATSEWDASLVVKGICAAADALGYDLVDLTEERLRREILGSD